MQLTKYGVWIGSSLAEDSYGAAAALAERLGFGALWLGGSPRLPALRGMLEGSEKLVVATGIVNVWQYEPAELAQEFQALDAEFPGRTLLGIGIGHPEATSEYKTPLAKMREFFDGLAAARPPVPRERMVAAALGPKMLDLAFERSLGTHPYFVPPEHTRFARERLGAAALVAPELAVSISGGDADANRDAARKYATLYCGLQNSHATWNASAIRRRTSPMAAQTVCSMRSCRRAPRNRWPRAFASTSMLVPITSACRPSA
jgi:probable F420-dependent oxidoreductase